MNTPDPTPRKITPEDIIEWIEPFGPNDEPVTMRVPASVAVAVQRKIATKSSDGRPNGFTYDTDERALDDFIVVHWAKVIPAAPTPEAVPQWAKDAARACVVDQVGSEYRPDIDAFAAIIARHAPSPAVGQPSDTDGVKNDDYWRGYKARLDEQTTETPEPNNPTLWRYFQNALEKNVVFHTIGVNRMPDGGFHFYIHPQSVSGDTQDYLLWPDPFNWSDMLVNRLDSPTPDVENFKKALVAAMQANKQGRGEG